MDINKLNNNLDLVEQILKARARRLENKNDLDAYYYNVALEFLTWARTGNETDLKYTLEMEERL